MVDHDRLFKELLTTFFAEFVELFIPELYKCLDTASLIFLDKEVFTDVTAGDAHVADLVVRVKLRGSESFILVHAETQSGTQKWFPRRMFQYFARLHEKHDLPVYPVVLYSFNRPRVQQPSAYCLHMPGLDVLSFQFKVIQLNRLSWKDYIKRPNPIAAALMVKMQFGYDERVKVKLECLRMIATLKLDRARTRLIAGFVDSYLRLEGPEKIALNTALETLEEPLKEGVMEIVTSWMEDGIQQGLERGLQQGLEQGLERGLNQGRFEEALMLVRKLLTRRLGHLEQAILEKVGQLPLQQLEGLAEDLLDMKTQDEIESWLSETERLD